MSTYGSHVDDPSEIGYTMTDFFGAAVAFLLAPAGAGAVPAPTSSWKP